VAAARDAVTSGLEKCAMDVKKLLGLRPKGATPAAFAATREDIERAASELGARVAELRRTRGARLLDGEPAAVERAEAELKAAEEEHARLSAMLDTLRQREAAAQAEEKRAAALRVIEAAETSCSMFIAWWRAEYLPLANALVHGLMLERAAIEAQKAAAIAMRENPELARLMSPPKLELLPGVSAAIATIGDMVRLPPAEAPRNRDPIFLWPPSAESWLNQALRTAPPVDHSLPTGFEAL
jgi:hypothetical protein